MKRYSVVLILLVQAIAAYKYHSHNTHSHKNRHHKQFIHVGPFKDLHTGFDPNAPKNPPLLEPPMYRNLGPVQVGFNKHYDIKKDANDQPSPAYYDQVAAPPKELEKRGIMEMKQNDIHLVEEVKPRINEKTPEPYYDPTEFGVIPVSFAKPPTNVYVVPVDMKNDLREEDPDHKAYKEQLKKTTHQMMQIDKAYYDPTLIPEHHYVDEQANQLHRAFLARTMASNAQSLADYEKVQRTHENIQKGLLNGLQLHSLSDYKQNHRIDQINKARRQNHELMNEVMPPINQKTPQNYYKKKRLRKRL